MSDLPSIEVTDEVLGDIARQLDPDAAWSFARLDMLPAPLSALRSTPEGEVAYQEMCARAIDAAQRLATRRSA